MVKKLIQLTGSKLTDNIPSTCE